MNTKGGPDPQRFCAELLFFSILHVSNNSLQFIFWRPQFLLHCSVAALCYGTESWWFV